MSRAEEQQAMLTASVIQSVFAVHHEVQISFAVSQFDIFYIFSVWFHDIVFFQVLNRRYRIRIHWLQKISNVMWLLWVFNLSNSGIRTYLDTLIFLGHVLIDTLTLFQSQSVRLRLHSLRPIGRKFSELDALE